MNPRLKALIDKYFGDNDIETEHPGLLNDISELVGSASAAGLCLKADASGIPNEEELLRTLQASLRLTARHLAEEDYAHIDTPLAAAHAVKKVCVESLGREQKILRELKHLKTIQLLARAGSWELPLTGDNAAAGTYWSEPMYMLLGVIPGSPDLTYEAYRALVHPEDVCHVTEEVARAIEQTGRYDIEYRMLLEGKERFFREVGEIIRDAATGDATKLIGASFDITEVRLAEQELIKTNLELRTLFNTMQDVFFSINLEKTKVLQVSPACLHILGYTMEEVLQDAELLFRVVFDEDKEQFDLIHEQLENGETVLSELRIRHRSGHLRWVEYKLTPTLRGSGELIRIDGIIADITERKETELALAENELKYRSLLENLNDAITVANEQLNFTFVTKSMSRLIGFPVEEIVGTSAMRYIHPDDHGAVDKLVSVLKSAPGTPIPFELRFLTADGGYIWVQGCASSHLEHHAVRGYIANFRNVTDKIEYQRALEQSNERLSKTNSELDRFVYSVSHDLRAPLASVIGLIEYTASETENEDILQSLQMMKESIRKLDTFIVDILDYSRNARLEVKKHQIDFTELLRDARNNLKFMNTGNSIVAIRTSVEEDGLFYSDKSRIQIILNNLISNSLRYYDGNKANPFVEVNIIAKETAALIVIKDNGIGIEPEYHQKIFDMFFRLSDQSNGSGLGLYLVKETVEKLSGDLELTSTPGVGTQFKIFLPNLNN
jgi:PAS domain S-box-containing protein